MFLTFSQETSSSLSSLIAFCYKSKFWAFNSCTSHLYQIRAWSYSIYFLWSASYFVWNSAEIDSLKFSRYFTFSIWSWYFEIHSDYSPCIWDSMSFNCQCILSMSEFSSLFLYNSAVFSTFNLSISVRDLNYSSLVFDFKVWSSRTKLSFLVISHFNSKMCLSFSFN